MFAASHVQAVAHRPRSFVQAAAIAVLVMFVAVGVAGPWLAVRDIRVPIGRPFQPPSGTARLGQ